MWGTRRSNTQGHGVPQAPDARTSALLKQLAQLEKDGQKLDDAVRFFRDMRETSSSGPASNTFRKQSSLTGRSSFSSPRKDEPTEAIVYELQQLQMIKNKLQATVQEIEKLQGLNKGKAADEPQSPPQQEPQQPQQPKEQTITASQRTSSSDTSPEMVSTIVLKPYTYDKQLETVASRDLDTHDLNLPNSRFNSVVGPTGNTFTGASTGVDVTGTDADGVPASVMGPLGAAVAMEANTPRSISSRVTGTLAALQAAGLSVKDAVPLAPTPTAHSRLASSTTGMDMITSKGALAAAPAGPSLTVEELTALVAEADDGVRLHQEVRRLRELAASRDALRAELTALQPKAAMAIRMKQQVASLQESAAETEALQARLTTLSEQVERLPALQAQVRRAQASIAEVKTLEAKLADHERTGIKEQELIDKLKAKEAEQTAKVKELTELKTRVEMMAQAAREAEQLEMRFAVLAPVASRLPVLRAQTDTLANSCAEVEKLEFQLEELKQVAQNRRILQQQIATIRPQAEAVESLRSQLQQLQQQVEEAEQLRAAVAAMTQEAATATSSAAAAAAAASAPGTVYTPSMVRAVGGHMPEHVMLHPSAMADHSLPGMLPTRARDPYGGTHRISAPGTITDRTSSLGGTGMVSGGGVSATTMRMLEQLPEPKINLQLQVKVEEVMQALPGVPPDVVARLQEVGVEVTQAQAALEELEQLESHRQHLHLSIESLKTSPAALNVLKLQHELLALQHKEVEALEAQVESMAGVGTRLVELRRQLAELDAQEEQEMILQAQLEEMQEVAEMKARTREQDLKAAAIEKEVAALETASARLSAATAQRQALEVQLKDLKSQQQDVERMSREVASLASVALTLSKLTARHTVLTGKAAQLTSLQADVASLEQRAVDVQALDRQKAILVAQLKALPQLQEEVKQLTAQVEQFEALKAQAEEMKTRLQDHDSIIAEHQSLKQRSAALEAQHTEVASRALAVTALAEQLEQAKATAARHQELQSALSDPQLQNDAAEVARLESELDKLQRQAEQLPALRIEALELKKLVLDVEGLQTEVQALRERTAKAPELKQQVESLRASALEVDQLERQLTMLMSNVEEASVLKEQVNELSRRTADLPALREQHASLMHDAATVTLLRKDVEVLSLKANLEKDLSFNDSYSLNNGNGTPKVAVDGNSGLQGFDWAAEADAVMGITTGDHGTNGVPGRGAGAALEEVFTRLRMAEAEKAGLEAQNVALAARVDELSHALSQSHAAVDKLRGLVAAVGRIRAAGGVHAVTSA